MTDIQGVTDTMYDDGKHTGRNVVLAGGALAAVAGIGKSRLDIDIPETWHNIMTAFSRGVEGVRGRVEETINADVTIDAAEIGTSVQATMNEVANLTSQLDSSVAAGGALALGSALIGTQKALNSGLVRQRLEVLNHKAQECMLWFARRLKRSRQRTPAHDALQSALGHVRDTLDARNDHPARKDDDADFLEDLQWMLESGDHDTGRAAAATFDHEAASDEETRTFRALCILNDQTQIAIEVDRDTPDQSIACVYDGVGHAVWDNAMTVDGSKRCGPAWPYQDAVASAIDTETLDKTNLLMAAANVEKPDDHTVTVDLEARRAVVQDPEGNPGNPHGNTVLQVENGNVIAYEADDLPEDDEQTTAGPTATP